MSFKLCLHGVGIKHQNQLLEAVHKLLPKYSVRYKVKEKYLVDNDMYKYRAAVFKPLKGQSEGLHRVICRYGIMVVADRPVRLADVIFEFDPTVEGIAQTKMLAQKLLAGKLQFILEEPELKLRIDQMRGRFQPEDMEEFDDGTAATALRCYVPWQLFAISQVWSELLAHKGAQTYLRQMRVKLRRLRSLLALLKPLLSQPLWRQWNQRLKSLGERLSAAREYDVALMICAKIRTHNALGEAECHTEAMQTANELNQPGVPKLALLLLELRAQALNSFLKGAVVNSITREMVELLLALYNVPAERDLPELDEFVAKRLDKWYHGLLALPERYPDSKDMEQLHRIRIRLKRFRYALQGIPRPKASPALLRRLKFLQDSLGLIHDDYVNQQLIDQLLLAHPEDEDLVYECALFTGWEQSRAEIALERLPDDWERFVETLTDWYEN